MAISAEQLNIILTAKDKAFAAAMDKNAKRIAKFSQDANKDLGFASAGFDKLAKGVAAFATVAAVQQLGQMVRDAANKLGDLRDAADAIGITTDALQELQYAAQLSGVSADVLQSSMQKLSKNLGDAAMGGTAAKKTFDALGLSGAVLSTMPLNDAIGAIADKLAAVENPAQRATLATDLFGKSGLAMVNMLADGSAGLNAMAAEAQSLGVVINKNVIDNAAAAADKLDALSMVVSANLTEALVNLSPVLIAAAQGLATMSQAVKDFLRQDYRQQPVLDEAALRAAAAEVEMLRTEIDALAQAKYDLHSIEVQTEHGKPPTIPQLDAANENLRIAQEAYDAAKRGYDLRQKEIAAASGTIQGMMDENAAMKENIRLSGLSAEAKIKEVAASRKQEELRKAFLEANALAGGMATDEQAAAITALADANEQLYIKSELAKVAQAGAAKGMSDSAIAAEKAKEAVKTYQGQVSELGLTLNEFESISKTIQSSMEDAFMGMVDGTSSAKDAFRSMAADIIKELYRVLVVQRMVGQVATATSAGSGLLGMIGGALGLTGGAPVKASASGNYLRAGQPSVVGEHGRELFVPSSAGRVLSVPQSKAAVSGGGVTVMQTINVTTGVQQTVRAEIMNLMPQISEASKSAVLDARRRGGSFRAAFG